MTTAAQTHPTTDAVLQRTPLYDLHVAQGARMVPFAGFEMPLHYKPGILKEHLHTRAAAGLFDVSHMGQALLRPKSGNLADAKAALETLVPVDVLGLAPWRQRYALFTNDHGGIIDDLMVANLEDALLLIVNAATKDGDIAHLRAHLADTCVIEPLSDRALLAIQGPRAEEAFAALAPQARDMRFMEVRRLPVLQSECLVSRSGYTGEDGFEISVPASEARALAEALLRHEAVEPIGLGARDSLRLEAGLCLYGTDIDTDTTPVEAALEWAIQKVRRAGGARAGGFPGADTVLRQMPDQARRRRVGLRPKGRAPIRKGTALFESPDAAAPVGTVTSGVFAPSLNAPAAMGYVETAFAAVGTELYAEVRNSREPVTISPMPFVAHRYKRNPPQ